MRKQIAHLSVWFVRFDGPCCESRSSMGPKIAVVLQSGRPVGADCHRSALDGLVDFEIELLRHGDFRPIAHTLVLHDRRLHCGVKHARACQDIDFLHRATLDHNLGLDHALRAVLQRALWHFWGHLRGA